MRPPLRGQLGQWPTSVIVRLHPDANKLALTVTVVTGYVASPIAYADISVKALDETGMEMPVIPADAKATVLAPIDHQQIGSYEILIKQGQEIASLELTYQGAKETYRITEIRDLVDPEQYV